MSDKLELGFIGLGRMGYNMCSRILDSQTINLHVHNRHEEPALKLAEKGATAHDSIEDLVKGLWQKKKIVWLMLPAGEATEDTISKLLKLLKKGDVIINGANSNFHDSLTYHEKAKKKGIRMLDVGVSGGVIAADRGYPMMIGGDKETFEYCRSIFESFGIAEGYGLVGEAGAGHYVKMIHNAIEYGMMQAISEGFDLLENGRFKDLDLKEISHIWNHGTIVSSFLMEMVENALTKDQKLGYLKPYVEDNGEGRWSAIEALEFNVPFVVNSYALNARYISRDDNSFAFRMLAAMRNEFGDHPIKK